MNFRRLLLMSALLGAVAVIAFVATRDRTATPAPSPAAETAVVDEAGPEEIAAAHILIGHQDSRPALPGATRTREEARRLALEVSVMAMDKRAGFDELAREYSDDPAAGRSGGYLGILRRGRLPLELEVPLWGLEVDQIYPPVETPSGFHVLKRLPLRRAVVRHILVAWAGRREASSAITRNRAQAEIVAHEVLAQCLADPDAFCDLAARYSDDPASRFQCGLVGLVEPTMLPPAFEEELFTLSPGEISEQLVETEFGFHIVYRDPAEQP